MHIHLQNHRDVVKTLQLWTMQHILWASAQNPSSPPTATILRYTNMNMMT